MPTPKEILCRWVDAFNRGDAEALAALYAENAVNHQVCNEPVVGKAAIREMFLREFAEAEMTAIVENMFEDGEWAILEWKDPWAFVAAAFSMWSRARSCSKEATGTSFPS